MPKDFKPTSINRNAASPRPKRVKKVISWSHVSQPLIAWFTNVITDDGSAVLYGRTMDETTLSILVLAGNDKIRKYVSHAPDMQEVMLDILDEMEIEAQLPLDA